MRRLLVASTGGHLSELVLLAPRLRPASDQDLWVTFDSEQSRRLLHGRDVRFVRNTPPRDLGSVVRNIGAAWRVTRGFQPDDIVTTGAGIALSFAPVAVSQDIPMHYIECSARTESPSLTGRLLEIAPRLRLYAQDPQFAVRRWSHAGSVFDRYISDAPRPDHRLRRVVVTVGSLHFGFKRLLDRLRSIVPAGVEVVLQAGVDAEEVVWPGALVHRSILPDILDAEMAAADVVIAHAGIGSALAALEAGKVPILVPRLKRHQEHVDDHQEQIARMLAQRGLAIHADASTLSLHDLTRAAALRASAGEAPRDFQLR